MAHKKLSLTPNKVEIEEPVFDEADWEELSTLVPFFLTHTQSESPEDKPLYWEAGGHLWLDGVTQQTVNTRGVCLWFFFYGCVLARDFVWRCNEWARLCSCGNAWVCARPWLRESGCVLSYLVVWYLRGESLSQHWCRQVGPTAGRVGQVIASWWDRGRHKEKAWEMEVGLRQMLWMLEIQSCQN